MTAANAQPARTTAINRRQFIGLAWAAASAALLVQAGVALYQFLKPNIAAGSFGTKVSA